MGLQHLGDPDAEIPPTFSFLQVTIHVETSDCAKEVAVNSPHCGINVGKMWSKPCPATKLMKVSENSEKGGNLSTKKPSFQTVEYAIGSGGWNRTNGLQVMSLTSYHCSTPQRFSGLLRIIYIQYGFFSSRF